uniref:Uncharacterized protein n=1 Tax=Canis lupus dingo TaxID=286419 RepID=A0A8C0QTB4_CANLU
MQIPLISFFLPICPRSSNTILNRSVKVEILVFYLILREKNSGSKCVISMHSRTTTTIQDPKNPEHRKTFTFDLAYWSHDGFQKDKDEPEGYKKLRLPS